MVEDLLEARLLGYQFVDRDWSDTTLCEIDLYSVLPLRLELFEYKAL
jgi:hypothetical protein